jgi:hypothetical protein
MKSEKVHTAFRFTMLLFFILIIGSVLLLFSTGGYALGSAYKISGYVNADVSAPSSGVSLNSGISVNIEGTDYKTVTDDNGYFELKNIPESQNTYTLKISKTCYLTRTVSDVKLTGNIAIGSQSSPLMIWAGDIPVNGKQDDAINISDVLQLSVKFNSAAGDSRYDANLDFNRDNGINIADVMIIAKNFNKASSSYPAAEITVPSAAPTPTPSVTGAPYKIFLLAGQSNMCGIGMNHELPSDLKNPVESVKIYAAGTIESSMANKWGTLTLGYGTGGGNFGPEFTFGRDIAPKLPDSKVLLIKVSWSGTSLSGDWRPPSAGGTTGKLWNEFVSNVKKGLAALEPGIDYEIAGMCWMQGESDACAPNIAADYEANLTAFINDVRKEFNVPDMPFVIAMIDDSSTWPHNAVVRQGQLNVAEKVPHVGIFDTKDLETDGSHYKTQGILDMGTLFAETMYQELQK